MNGKSGYFIQQFDTGNRTGDVYHIGHTCVREYTLYSLPKKPAQSNQVKFLFDCGIFIEWLKYYYIVYIIYEVDVTVRLMS